MSSCIATSRLVHNGGYIQKQLQLSPLPEILRFGRLYLVTKVLINLNRFYVILATIQHFKFRKSAIMDQFVTFCKRVYTCNFVISDPEKMDRNISRYFCSSLEVQYNSWSCMNFTASTNHFIAGKSFRNMLGTKSISFCCNLYTNH